MKLVLNYLSNHLKVSLEYKLSFLLSTIAQGLYMIVELFVVYSIFNKFKLLNVYSIEEILLSFSTIWFGYSLSEMLFRGFDSFANVIRNGNFDILLIRPRNIYLSIFGTDICYEKLSRVLVSLGLFIYSVSKVVVSFNILKLILIINMIIGGSVLFLSFFILAASFCFVTVQGLEVVNIITNGSKQFAEYPIRIYKKSLRIIFTFVIPVTIINYYPINYLIGSTTNIIYIFMPLISIVLLVISIMVFNLGISKYCSTGS